MVKYLPPQTVAENTGRMTRLGMTTLLVITHGGVAIMTVSVLQAITEWHFLAQLLLVMIVGGAFGTVLNYGVMNDLERAETALYRLGSGIRVEPLPTKNREPMRFLMEHVNTLVERERALKQMREQLRGQIGEAAAQEERSRLARDLHDSIKQQIFSISVSAAAVQARWEHDAAGAQKALADVRKSAQEAMVEMRAMLQQLAPAPLEKVGLTQALRDQCEALEYRSGAKVNFEFGDLPADERFPPGAQEAIFRVAQEALTNVARHARATHVMLRLSADEVGMQLEIKDDGQGFQHEAAGKGMGLSNMAARAESVDGVLTVDSAPGHGTSLLMRIPYSLPIVTQVDDTTPLSPQAERYFIDSKRRFQLAAPAYFVALVMLFVFVLVIGRGDRQGWELVLGMAFGSSGAIITLLSGRALWRGIRDMRKLRDEVGRDAPQVLITRYNLWLGISLLPLFVFIFVPEAVINPFGSGAALLVAGLGGVGTVIAFVRSFALYRRYIHSLSVSKLRVTVREDFPESTWSRYSWVWSLPMLMNLMFDFPPRFPPLERGDWLDLSLPSAGVFFLVASLAYWRYHHNLTRKIGSEGSAS